MLTVDIHLVKTHIKALPTFSKSSKKFIFSKKQMTVCESVKKISLYEILKTYWFMQRTEDKCKIKL